MDWSLAPALESETFTSSTSYDALNRPVALTTPHNDTTPPSVIRPGYNEANLLEQVNVNLRGADAVTAFVTNIDYDAKAQRKSIAYANRTTTEYEYDKDTFRLIHLKTNRAGFPVNEQVVQDLFYTYDPVGNITHIRDDADIQNVIYFRNQRVEPSSDYEYDAIYRLTSAKGREHLGQTASNQLNPPRQTDHDDSFLMNLPHPGDGNAMGNYTERYEYDPVGNILQIIHRAASGGWRRSYSYNEPSLVQPGFVNNRLNATKVGRDDNPNAVVEPYVHDPHGNMTSMPHLPLMEWDSKDQLHATQRQVVNDGPGEKTYYVYDASGQRVRKVTESANGVKKQERLYLGSFEIYREYGGGTTTLERETLQVMDDKRRIALVETKTIDVAVVSNPQPLVRYQFDNHLGSASLELDSDAAVISYEEYYPYGSTSYQSGRTAAEVSLKRYRYTGKEQDQETGLYYHGARYYAPWLGRWTSCDPAGMIDGTNVYVYVRVNPIRFIDPSGGSLEDAVKRATSYVREAIEIKREQRELAQAIRADADVYNKVIAQYQAAGGKVDKSTLDRLDSVRHSLERHQVDLEKLETRAVKLHSGQIKLINQKGAIHKLTRGEELVGEIERELGTRTVPAEKVDWAKKAVENVGRADRMLGGVVRELPQARQTILSVIKTAYGHARIPIGFLLKGLGIVAGAVEAYEGVKGALDAKSPEDTIIPGLKIGAGGATALGGVGALVGYARLATLGPAGMVLAAGLLGNKAGTSGAPYIYGDVGSRWEYDPNPIPQSKHSRSVSQAELRGHTDIEPVEGGAPTGRVPTGAGGGFSW